MKFVDDTHFFFTASYDDSFAQMLAKADNDMSVALREKEYERPYRIFEEIPFWANGRGDVRGKRPHLYYYAEGEIRSLSDTYESVESLTLSEDRRTLLYTTKTYQGKAPLGNHLMRLEVATGEAHEISPLKGEARYGGSAFLSATEIVLTASQRFDRIGNACFYRLDLASGSVREVYGGDPYGLGNSVGSDVKMGTVNSGIKADAEGFYYTSTVVDHAPLLRANYDGQISFVTKGKEVIMEYVPYQDGFLVVAMVSDAPNEVYFLDKQGNMRAMTSLNTDLLSTYAVCTPEEFTFKNEQGLELGGFVIRPAGYESGKKYPILDIHGVRRRFTAPFSSMRCNIGQTKAML